jgi:hypothetical protein
MPRVLVLIVLGLGVAWPAAGVARAAIVAPAGAFGWPIALTVGPRDHVLVLGGLASGITYVERDSAGRWGAIGTLTRTQAFRPAAAWAPDGSAVVVAGEQPAGEAAKLVVFRRAAGAASFGAPMTVLQDATIVPYRTATDARGDIAMLVYRPPAPMLLLSAARGGTLAAAQEVLSSTDGSGVAVGGGRVVHAYYDSASKGVYARWGAAGSPLGAAQLLAANAPYSDIVAAVDDAGNATVAFTRANARRHYGPSELVAVRARPGARFGAPAMIGRGAPAQLGAGFAAITAAAAGTTTALAFDSNAAKDTRLRVAIAHGAAAFAGAQAPSVPASSLQGASGAPRTPVLAVGRQGGVLLAYSYGNAAHATLRPAGSRAFSAPRVISSLGHGAIRRGSLVGTVPLAALLGDRRPLLVHNDLQGALVATTRLNGPRPDLTAPRVKVALPVDAAAQLLASNAVTARVSCARDCLVQGHATLTGDGHRTFVDAGATVLRRGRTLTRRFVFNPNTRAGGARPGVRIRVTITVENQSGASRVVANASTSAPRPTVQRCSPGRRPSNAVLR